LFFNFSERYAQNTYPGGIASYKDVTQKNTTITLNNGLKDWNLIDADESGDETGYPDGLKV
jgi:hypothetical protein